MARIDLDYFSPTLGFRTDVRVFIPTPDSDEILNNKSSDYFYPGAKFQVVYLLHGAYGDYSDWGDFTGVQRYAQDRKLAVVMPSADNSFYQDMWRGPAFLTYLTRELPAFLRARFPISAKRENSFTAGLSMGGYGAWRLALTCPEQYSAAISLSGAIDMVGLTGDIHSGLVSGPVPWRDIVQAPEAAAGSDADLFTLADKLRREGRPLPRLFQSCGTEDFIYPSNLAAHRRLEQMGVAVTYEEHPGIHCWDYWDENIRRALDWLPLAGNAVAE